MAIISTYPIDGSVNLTDKLIGTDVEDSSKTKNYTISSILALKQIGLTNVLAAVDTTNQAWECELDIMEYCKIYLRWTWDYEMSVSDPWIVTAFRSEDRYHIYGMSKWETQVYIKKNWVTVHTISVEVSDIQNLNLSVTRMDLETWEYGPFYVTSGNGWYRVYKNNNNISVYATSDPNKFNVIGNKAWYTTVMVYDDAGKFRSFGVYVSGGDYGDSGESDNLVHFWKTVYHDTDSIEWLSALYFEVLGNPEEIGVQFQDIDGQIVRQKMEIRDDGIYILWLDEYECLSCYNAFTPYFIANGVTTYYATNKYLAFWLSETVWLASDNWIEINSIVKYVEGRFYDFWKLIKDIYGNVEWYVDGSSAALDDALTDLIETPGDIIILVRTSWKIIVAYMKWERDLSNDLSYAKQELWVLYDKIELAYHEFEQYKSYLTTYNIQFVESYLGVSTMTMAVWPGKLKAVKSSDRIVTKVDSVTRTWKITKVLWDLEVKNTLQRINDKKSKYSQDGITFRNEQNLLPSKWVWYYSEWTVDTPWLTNRWPRRIVLWNNWEQYFTEDHYATFIKIN